MSGWPSSEPKSPLAARRARLLSEVPPFRPVAIQLLNLVGDVNQPLARIVNLLRTDAVLTAEVLRLANSPLLGFRSEIRNVLQASALLGLDRINSLIMTTAMRGLTDGLPGTLPRQCWRHNLATAIACERLAPVVGLEKERCYMAGLIHDIGRLAMIKSFPEYQSAMMRAVVEDQRDPVAAEKALFGLDHAEAGRWLLAQWGCPLELQNVAFMHDNPPGAQSNHRQLILLVQACSRLTGLLGFPVFPTSEPPRLEDIAATLPEGAGQQLGAEFASLAEFVPMRVNSIELSLG